MGAPEAMAGDGDDFGKGATCFGKHRDGGATNVVEVKMIDTGGLACVFPLVGKISFLKR